MAIKDRRTETDAAEELGLAALVFLTEDEDRLGHFLAETGFSPGDLRTSAGSPATLAAVLDHLLADESMLLVFAAGAGIDPATIAPVRALLPGGDAEMATNGSGYNAPSTRPATTKREKLPIPKRRFRDEA